MRFLKNWPVVHEISQNKTLHLGQEAGVWGKFLLGDGL